jgi:hypothetical protein
VDVWGLNAACGELRRPTGHEIGRCEEGGLVGWFAGRVQGMAVTKVKAMRSRFGAWGGVGGVRVRIWLSLSLAFYLFTDTYTQQRERLREVR